MNTAVYTEIRPNVMANHQSLLPLATEGVLRYVWDPSRFDPAIRPMAAGQTYHRCRHLSLGQRRWPAIRATVTAMA